MSRELGTGLFWDLIADMWDHFDLDVPPRRFIKTWREYRPEQQYLYATHLCNAEIRNGGFYQFFHNQSGILAPDAVAGYRAIGLSRTANLVSRAMSFFGEPYPRHFRARHTALRKIKGQSPKEWDPFYKLDGRFYELTDSENEGYSYAADKYALQFLPKRRMRKSHTQRL